MTATILVFCPCHPVFPRSLQHGFTRLEEAAGERSFNYANMKIINRGCIPDRFDESSDCFSIFTACHQIKLQIIFSKRITTFKQIITLHNKT